MLLGKRIKELRKQHGLTQEQLGKKINVSKGSVCFYESERRTPSLETLNKLCQVFNTDIQYLLGNDHFIIKDSDNEYGIYMSNEEIQFIEELRKSSNIHSQIIENPKRTAEIIRRKIN